MSRRGLSTPSVILVRERVQNRHMRRYSVQGKRVKALREDAGFSQGEFVVRLRQHGATTNQSQLSQVERDVKGLSVEVLAAFANALDTSADYLLGLTDDPTRRDLEDEQVILVERDPGNRAWLQRLFSALQRLPDDQREDFYRTLQVMYRGFGLADRAANSDTPRNNLPIQ